MHPSERPCRRHGNSGLQTDLLIWDTGRKIALALRTGVGADPFCILYALSEHAMPPGSVDTGRVLRRQIC